MASQTGSAVPSGGTAPAARSAGMRLAHAGQRAVRRDLVVEPTGPQVVDQLVELVVA